MTRVAGDQSQFSIWYVALAYVLLSAPQAINFFRLLPFAIVLVLVGLLWLSRYPESLRALKLPIPLVLLSVWLFLTALWSEGRGITVVQASVTLTAFLVASVTAQVSTLRQVVVGLALGGGLIAILSFALGLFLPAYGLMPPGYQGGSLRGLYVHRNLLAEALLPSFVASLFSWSSMRARRFSFILTALNGGAILAAKSSTALSGMLVAILVLAVVLLSIRVGGTRRPLALTVGLFLVAVVGVLGSLFSDVVFGFLGRDTTLTGRTPIWAAVTKLIARAPAQGWGWGSTWSPNDYVRRFVEASVKFDVPSAHNGYLDAAVQSGLVGLSLFVVLYLYAARGGILQVIKYGSLPAAFPLAFVISLAVYNFGESSLVSTQSLYVAGAASLSWGAISRKNYIEGKRDGVALC